MVIFSAFHATDGFDLFWRITKQINQPSSRGFGTSADKAIKWFHNSLIFCPHAGRALPFLLDEKREETACRLSYSKGYSGGARIMAKLNRRRLLFWIYGVPSTDLNGIEPWRATAILPGQRSLYEGLVGKCISLCYWGELRRWWICFWLEVFEGQVVRPKTPKRGLNLCVLLMTMVGLTMCSLFIAKPGGLSF